MGIILIVISFFPLLPIVAYITAAGAPIIFTVLGGLLFVIGVILGIALLCISHALNKRD